MIQIKTPEQIEAANNINQLYQEKCSVPSDINELLPYLKEYADKVESVTEMGVRHPTSTYAFLSSKAKKIRSYDIETQPDVAIAIDLAKKAGIDYIYEEADVLKISIEETDLLFIDTYHSYAQLTAELARHAGKVGKFLCFHDISSFRLIDEPPYNAISAFVPPANKNGIWPAIQEFLEANKEWSIDLELTFNNGLMILKKN
jgi:hypothetical protein